ncbi:MAG: ABC transporter permease [Bryobacteraceae bacterium]|jgi:predicted permease
MSFRALAKRPSLTLTALLTIALGIGANSAIFTVVRAVLLRPLPFRQPEGLVYVWQTHPSLGHLPVTYPDYLDLRSARSFNGLVAYTIEAMNKTTLEGEGLPEQLQATMASHELFPLMGIGLIDGRFFSAEEERGKQQVALISEALWKRKFGASPHLVGRAIRLDKQAFTVIGIVRQREAFPVWADLWIPLSLVEPQLQQTRRFHPLELVGRLRDGVSVAQAQTEMSAIGANLARQYPATDRNMGAHVVPMLSEMTSSIRPALLIVWMAVGLVLLVACANVAHLLLARTMSRQRELAIRAALGASSFDLLRLLSAECLALVVCGGALGAVVGGLLVSVLKNMAASYIPRMGDAGFDAGVALYTFAAMFVCAGTVALPSLGRVARTDLGQTMKQSDAQLFSGRAGRLGSMMMAAEIALAFVVFAGAILLTRSFASLRHVDPGFRTSDVLAMNLTMTGPDGWASAQHLLNDRTLRAIPGVTSVAVANMAPLTLDRTELSRFSSRFGIVGRTFSPGSYPVAQLRWVSPDYFRTLGIPLLHGRLLTERDRNQPNWLINEALARKFFPGGDAVGRKILLNVDTPGVYAVEIAGVVGDARDLSLDLDPQPTAYLIDATPQMSLLVGVAGDPKSVAPAIARVIRQTAPDTPITLMEPLDHLAELSMARYRFVFLLMAGFAALSGILSAIGIYGVIAYAVGRRMREFGVRTAIGATPMRLMRLVLGEGLVVTMAGAAAGGLLFALIAAKLFRPILFHVRPFDVVSLEASAVAVVLIALVAMSVPARRASRADPCASLKAE